AALLPEAERRRMLVDWNATRAEIPARTVHRLIEAQAARTPDATALISGKTHWTFAELNRRANQLARHLRRLGVGPDAPVGLAVERPAEMVAGMLGVLKAGGAYLPLDPSYPRDRLRFMLEDSGARVLLTQEHLAGAFAREGLEVVC